MKILAALTSALVITLAFASAEAQQRTKFPVSVSSKTLGYGPLWAASKQGFFERQGLDVELVLVRGAEKSVQELVARSVNASASGAEGIISAVDHGLDLAMIAGIINRPTYFVMAGKRYRSYNDRRGTVIGSSGLSSGTAFTLRSVLSSRGLEYGKDYKLINVGPSAPAFAALTTGLIAATILPVPLNYEAMEMGLNVIGQVVDDIPNLQLATVSVSRPWAEKNRPLIVRFLRGLVMGMRWLIENNQAGREFLATEMQMKPELARKGWEYYVEKRVWDRDLNVSVEGVRTIIRLYYELNQTKLSMANPAKYLDPSYLREALSGDKP
jgi:ABC-type nitrate/sulfonate/bicarbonate transport system substrate-binding protein